MADNQTIPATAFSVSGSADGFSVQGSYPFINEIRSEDTTCFPVHSCTGFRMVGGSVRTTRSHSLAPKPAMAVNSS